jgi:hypothetical protein
MRVVIKVKAKEGILLVCCMSGSKMFSMFINVPWEPTKVWILTANVMD